MIHKETILVNNEIFVFKIPEDMSRFFIKHGVEDYYNKKDTYEEYSTLKRVIEDIVIEEINLQLNGEVTQETIKHHDDAMKEYITAELVMLSYLDSSVLEYFVILIKELTNFIIEKLSTHDLVMKHFRLLDITPTYAAFIKLDEKS